MFESGQAPEDSNVGNGVKICALCNSPPPARTPESSNLCIAPRHKSGTLDQTTFAVGMTAMNLLARINFALIPAFAIAAVAADYACDSLLQASARNESMHEAGLMLDSALAARTYTTEEIVPLLREGLQQDFLPQSVPFYGATQHFLALRRNHPEYAYKEAALNPTNPRDRATDWEADLIEQFRNNEATTELVGVRDTPMGSSLYRARPIRVEPGCLSCHSQPAAAPATLIARYGPDHGFGWQAHEVVGAQVVSVPLTGARQSAEVVLRGVMAWIAGILAGTLIFVNTMLYLLVVRPVRGIAAIADEVSLGNMSAPDFPAGGGSELQALVRSFNRMRTSLAKALKLLGS